MSMYNLVHGVNPMAGLLLRALGFTSTNQIPRFRDCYWNGNHIAIYTRTGGGNREFYENLASCQENYPEYFDGDDAPTGPWNDDLRKVAGFVRDDDDDFDSTYATFLFAPSPKLAEALKGIPATDATPAQKWESFLERLASGKDDPQVARVLAAMAPTVSAITQAVTSRAPE